MEVIVLPLHLLHSVKKECGAEQLGRNLEIVVRVEEHKSIQLAGKDGYLSYSFDEIIRYVHNDAECMAEEPSPGEGGRN